MQTFTMTPALQQDAEICNEFAKSLVGTGQFDDSQADEARSAANRIFTAAYGPLTADGTAAHAVDARVLDLINERAVTIRDAIRSNLIAGRSQATDYYKVLYDLLADSGAFTSLTLPLSAEMATTLHAQLLVADLASPICPTPWRGSWSSTGSVCSSASTDPKSSTTSIGATPAIGAPSPG